MNTELWNQHQVDIIYGAMRSHVYYKVLLNQYLEKDIKNVFWKDTIDAHIIQFILKWSILFGKDDNKYHWKKIITDPNEQNELRDKIYNQFSGNKNEWADYRQSFLSFRDKYVAHRDLSYPPTPYTENALNILFLYDDFIRKIQRDQYQNTFKDPRIKKMYENLEKK